MPLAALLLPPPSLSVPLLPASVPPPPSLPLPVPLSVPLPVPLELFLLPAAVQLPLRAESSAGSRIQAAGAAEHMQPVQNTPACRLGFAPFYGCLPIHHTPAVLNSTDPCPCPPSPPEAA